MKKFWRELDGSTKGLVLFHVAGYTMCGFMLLGGKLFGNEVGGFVGMTAFWAIFAIILVIRDFKRKIS